MSGDDFQQTVILVGIDGTPSSLRAGAYASGIARLQHARLVCVFVHAPAMVTTTAVPGLDVGIREASNSVADELRELMRSRVEALGLDAEFIERNGNVYPELVRTAKELRADTIVVGASTHAGHRIVGSVGARLIRTGIWPVTVVP